MAALDTEGTCAVCARTLARRRILSYLASERERSALMRAYETCFTATFGTNYYAFCFWKARVALYALLRALDLQENDEVILPGYTCIVVSNAIRFAGAKPVYADIAPGRS